MGCDIVIHMVTARVPLSQWTRALTSIVSGRAFESCLGRYSQMSSWAFFKPLCKAKSPSIVPLFQIITSVKNG